MNRIYLALSVTAFAMSASPGAARADWFALLVHIGEQQTISPPETPSNSRKFQAFAMRAAFAL
jgi:hypothetical protein